MADTAASQNNRVLARLKRGPLTSQEAMMRLGVFRLASRIYDLRRMGLDITSEPVTSESGARFAEYRLRRGKVAQQ